MPMKDLSPWLAILSVWRGDLISEDGWRLLRDWRLLKDSRSDAEIFRTARAICAWRARPLWATASPAALDTSGKDGRSCLVSTCESCWTCYCY